MGLNTLISWRGPFCGHVIRMFSVLGGLSEIGMHKTAVLSPPKANRFTSALAELGRSQAHSASNLGCARKARRVNQFRGFVHWASSVRAGALRPYFRSMFELEAMYNWEISPRTAEAGFEIFHSTSRVAFFMSEFRNAEVGQPGQPASCGIKPVAQPAGWRVQLVSFVCCDGSSLQSSGVCLSHTLFVT